MKKLIIFLILFIPLCMQAQTKGKAIGDGYVWTDSLGYTNLDETSDSVLILDTRFSQAWYRIFVKGNATAQADSFYVQHGSVRYDQGGEPQDTVWGSWSPVQDSLFNSIHTMVNNTVGKDFLLYSPIHQLLRFTLLNYRAAIPARNCVITIQAVKD